MLVDEVEYKVHHEEANGDAEIICNSNRTVAPVEKWIYPMNVSTLSEE